jgi:hypothetical protein
LFISKGIRESLRLFAHAQKNKINLCFVDRLVQIDNDKKIKANQIKINEYQLPTRDHKT